MKKIKKFLSSLGPGIVTGASDDDPSGLVTYSQAGAQFGFSTLWTALLTFPLMSAIQEMCARIGLVTSQGLTGAVKTYYPKWLLWSLVAFSTPPIILNIGSNIAGMGAVCHLIVPAISPLIFSIAFTIVLVVLIVYLPYQKIAAILKYLCLSLLVYFVIPFFIKTDMADILKHTFIPTLKADKEFVGVLVAILGTTISPYLFFWQATMSVEDVKKKNGRIIVNRQVLENMKRDVNTGMLFSNMVMYAIILTTAIVLYQKGVHHIDTVEQAASALKPVAGNFAYYLFALGVVGTGLLTIPVLSGSLSYIYSEAFGWKGNLDKTFQQAKSFYGVIIVSLLLGLAINYLGISPIKALVYTAILYGVTAPVMILIILRIANDPRIMKQHTNKRKSNVLGWMAFIVMSAAALFLLYTYIIG